MGASVCCRRRRSDENSGHEKTEFDVFHYCFYVFDFLLASIFSIFTHCKIETLIE